MNYREPRLAPSPILLFRKHCSFKSVQARRVGVPDHDVAFKSIAKSGTNDQG